MSRSAALDIVFRHMASGAKSSNDREDILRSIRRTMVGVPNLRNNARLKKVSENIHQDDLAIHDLKHALKKNDLNTVGKLYDPRFLYEILDDIATYKGSFDALLRVIVLPKDLAPMFEYVIQSKRANMYLPFFTHLVKTRGFPVEKLCRMVIKAGYYGALRAVVFVEPLVALYDHVTVSLSCLTTLLEEHRDTYTPTVELIVERGGPAIPAENLFRFLKNSIVHFDNWEAEEDNCMFVLRMLNRRAGRRQTVSPTLLKFVIMFYADAPSEIWEIFRRMLGNLVLPRETLEFYFKGFMSKKSLVSFDVIHDMLRHGVAMTPNAVRYFVKYANAFPERLLQEYRLVLLHSDIATLESIRSPHAAFQKIIDEIRAARGLARRTARRLHPRILF